MIVDFFIFDDTTAQNIPNCSDDAGVHWGDTLWRRLSQLQAVLCSCSVKSEGGDDDFECCDDDDDDVKFASK